MKWSAVRTLAASKLAGSVIKKGAKHDKVWVYCNGMLVGFSRIGRHVEMKPWEIQGWASSLQLSQHDFIKLVNCEMSRDEFCAIALAAQR